MHELFEFVDELRACGNAKRADDLAAFFSHWEGFHEHPAGAGAYAIEQTDEMRRIVRRKDCPVMDRLADLDAFLRESAADARRRAERQTALAKMAGRTA